MPWASASSSAAARQRTRCRRRFIERRHDVAPTIPYQEPAALLASTQQELDSTPFVKLFNDPSYQKLMERWCAAKFGLGYSKFIAPCKVAVNEGRYRVDVCNEGHTRTPGKARV
jgi:hypothetical protein